MTSLLMGMMTRKPYACGKPYDSGPRASLPSASRRIDIEKRRRSPRECRPLGEAAFHRHDEQWRDEQRSPGETRRKRQRRRKQRNQKNGGAGEKEREFGHLPHL